MLDAVHNPEPVLSETARGAAKIILPLGTLSPAEFAAYYGKDGRGLPLDLIERSRVFPWLRLPRDSNGGITGFATPAEVVDYSAPDALRHTLSVLQPPAMDLARRSPGSPEEMLSRALRTPNAALWAAALDALGIAPQNTPPRLNRRAAQRIALAIVSEAFHNAMPPERLGALAVIRSYPPSLRRRAVWLLDTTSDTNPQRDLLFQMPILLLFQQALRGLQRGTKRKQVAQALGLPPSIYKLKPQAIGVIAYKRGLDRRDDDAQAGYDLEWITEGVCRALPDEMFRQRILTDIATSVSIGAGPKRAEECALWLATALAQLKGEGALQPPQRRALADYISASPDLIRESAVRQFNDALSIDAATSAATEFTEWLHLRQRAAHDGFHFKRPDWAPDNTKLSGTRWQFIRLTTEAELEAEGRRFSNCAGSYGPRCATGMTALYVLRRPATKNDAEHSLMHCPVIGGPAVSGSMLELARGSNGRPFIAQHHGPRNSEPPTSCAAAAHRFLASL